MEDKPTSYVGIKRDKGIWGVMVVKRSQGCCCINKVAVGINSGYIID